ncbi:MAG: hypothetical protein GQ544_04800, partial [Candidatus Aminicenantes bacterium]|nr:hypothetical protein [Candidatus Aminicenantes bacterium]
MKKSVLMALVLVVVSTQIPLFAQEGLVSAFKLKPCEIALQRLARPGTPFDKCGQKFVLLAEEGGSFEAWAYPLKILRGFNLSFYIGESTRPILAKDIVRFIEVTPEATILTYTYQSFTVKAIYITPIKEPGAIILLKVDSTVPLAIVCGFLPVLQPMWPAGIGGQFSYWNNDLKAYIISESTGQNHGLVGSPAASGLSYTPAHMLSDKPSEFRIPIPEPQKVKDKFIPIYLAGGKGKREAVLEVYKRLQQDPHKYYLENQEHFSKLQENTLQIKTPDKKLNLAFAWAKVAFDNLIVDNPELGKGMVAGLGASGTSGRPGFGWFFGGDAYINSLSMTSYGAHETVRDILAFTQKWQRNDGKMAHELSQAEGYVDWWHDYHYGYIHGDTTPYYIVAMYEYAKLSGDREFIKASWNSLQQAYDWCLSTDANNDGLMDNKKAGLGALEYGALTGIETDIYLGAVWVRATLAMQGLARIAGDRDYIEKAGRDHQRASKAFEERFWDEDSRHYAYAFNAEGKHVKEISPWNAVGLMWRLGTPEHSRLSLEHLSSAELMTDWGVRSISINSQYFQPLNYKYGAVWPFLTSWVTTALYTHHMPLTAWPLLKATAEHTFNHGLGSITEVFSGTHHVWPQEAVSHQGFSTAAVTLPLIRGMLGLEGDAMAKTITLSPQFPADWDRVQVKNLKIGKAAFSLDYQKQPGVIRMSLTAERAAGYRLTLAPALGPAAQVLAVEVDGRAADFSLEVGAQSILPTIRQTLNENPLSFEIRSLPGPEIFSVPLASQVGDP